MGLLWVLRLSEPVSTRGIAMRHPDRAGGGEAARAASAGTSPCARAEGQALIAVCRAGAEIALSEKR